MAASPTRRRTAGRPHARARPARTPSARCASTKRGAGPCASTSSRPATTRRSRRTGTPPSSWTCLDGEMRCWALAALLLVACGGGRPCPNDLPTSCPAPAPHYADVAPIFSGICQQCHAPGGQSSDKPLTSYDEVFSRRTTVLTAVFGCVMPPESANSQLTTAQRAQLLQWLVCGAPE